MENREIKNLSKFMESEKAKFETEELRKIFNEEFKQVKLTMAKRQEKNEYVIPQLFRLSIKEFENTFVNSIKYVKDRIFKTSNTSCYMITFNTLNPTENVVKEYIGDEFKTLLASFPKELKYYYETVMNSYQVIANTKKPKMYHQDGVDYINTFDGFKYQYVPTEELSKHYEKNIDNIKFVEGHILNVLCGGCVEIFNVVMSCIYKIVQGKKCTVCVVFKGLQGIGKTIVCELIQSVIGDNLTFKVSVEDDLFGKFTGHFIGKIFTYMDDVTFSGKNQKDFGSMMKTRISDSHVGYRDMHKKSVMLENINSWFLCCNPEKCPDFNESVKSNARIRYIICDICEDIQTPEYVKRLNDLIRSGNESFLKAFYYHCIQKDLSNFNEQVEAKKIPVTENKIRDIQKTLPQHVKFLKDNIHDEEIFTPITKKTLYEKFTDWHRSEHRTCPQIKNEFIESVMKYPFVTELAAARIKGIPYKKVLLINRDGLIKHFTEQKFIVENDEIENVLLEKKYDNTPVNELRAELFEKDKIIEELRQKLLKYESKLPQEDEISNYSNCINDELDEDIDDDELLNICMFRKYLKIQSRPETPVFDDYDEGDDELLNVSLFRKISKGPEKKKKVNNTEQLLTVFF